jgi:thioredoxin 1
MLQTFDTAITSSDLSIDRVLKVSLPVALLFFEHIIPPELLQSCKDLASAYAGKVLIVLMEKKDSTQTAARFNVSTVPSLVLLKNNQALETKANVQAADLKLALAYLAGEGPKPSYKPPQPVNPGPAAGGGPTPVTEANFANDVLQSALPVLVDFWAVWCGPCHMMDPTLDKLAHEQAGTLKVAKVNVDENPALARRYGVQGIPTMLVMVGGKELDRIVGALPESALRASLARWINPIS